VSTASFKVPKYFHITREIISLIQRGEKAEGQPVWSENEIIEKYKVSNTTARKALHELEKAGWVTRIKGKGTFVRNNTVERPVARIFGFTKNMIEAGRHPTTKLLGFHLREKDRTLTLNDRDFVMKGPYCEIDRLRCADGIPMMKETRFISLQLCPNIHRKDLEQSLYDIFEEEYRIHLVEIKQMVSSVHLEGEWLDVFNLEKPIPAFRVEGVSFSGKNLIVEMEDSIYRGDMYRFSVSAT
jgi:GntR family transcriptional regulator